MSSFPFSPQTRSLFQDLLDSAPDAMVIVDEQRSIVLINSESENLFGYKREELIGEKIGILIPERYSAIHSEHETAYFRNPKVRPMGNGQQLYARRKDGTEFPADISLSPLKTQDGIMITAAVRDVTEQKRERAQLDHYAEELKRSNAELESFAYTAAHDLSAPLRQIKTFCELLQDNQQENQIAEAKEHIGYIIRSVDQMQALVDGLLDHARIGAVDESIEPTDCSLVLDEVLKIMEKALNDSAACITRDALPTLAVQKNQLMRLFQNLLFNAINYRSNRPLKVHIRAVAQNGHWLFSVCDNGIGIDPKYSDEIFTVFKRLHGDGHRPGAGIGLASCRKIVELHHGRIWVESEPGKGSTFFFTFPFDE